MPLQGFNEGLRAPGNAKTAKANAAKENGRGGSLRSLFKSKTSTREAEKREAPLIQPGGGGKSELPINRQRSRTSLLENAEEDDEISASGRQIFIYALSSTIGYISLGTLVFCLWEKWSFVDGLYFTVVTLTTVGYGDQEPWVSQGAMLFCTVYALFGILLLGTALGIIAAELVEANDKAMSAARSAAMRGGGEEGGGGKGGAGGGGCWGGFKKWYNDNTSEMVQALTPSFVTLFFVLAVGMIFIFFDKADQKTITFIDALYFAVITTTTIGYGDYSPKTTGGKVFGVLYCLFGVSAVGSILSNIAGYFIEKKQKEAMAKILEKKVTREDFEKFDVDGDGKIEKTEFALRKLMLMGLIKIEDIAMVEKEFEIMDADGSGEIDFDDLDLYLKKQQEEEEAKKDSKKHEGHTNQQKRVFVSLPSQGGNMV